MSRMYLNKLPGQPVAVGIDPMGDPNALTDDAKEALGLPLGVTWLFKKSALQFEAGIPSALIASMHAVAERELATGRYADAALSIKIEIVDTIA